MQKIQIIAFLTALLVGSTALAHESVSDTSPRQSAWGRLAAGSQGPGNEPNLAGPPNSVGTRELFIKMMVSVVLVVVLGAGAIYGSKRLAGKFANLPGKRIKIVETVHLGPRKAVHLLRIGDRCLLIGSTNDNISKLADLTTEILMQEKVSTTYAENN